MDELKEKVIELKVVADTDDATSVQLKAPVAAVDDSHAGVPNLEALAPNKRPVSEREVVDLVRMPESDDFLSAIEKMSPEEIGHVLRALNESHNRYAQCLRQLTAVPEEPRSAVSIIGWWEARRIVFNLLVGAAGLPTVAFFMIFASAPLYWILEGVVAYAVAANVCYTAGCVSELFARRWWAESAKHFGPMLFTLGLMFSLAITLFAILYMPIVSVVGKWIFS